jgi:hypothetical protein
MSPQNRHLRGLLTTLTLDPYAFQFLAHKSISKKREATRSFAPKLAPPIGGWENYLIPICPFADFAVRFPPRRFLASHHGKSGAELLAHRFSNPT